MNFLKIITVNVSLFWAMAGICGILAIFFLAYLLVIAIPESRAMKRRKEGLADREMMRQQDVVKRYWHQKT